jgi:hypothetical protein
MAGWQTQPRGRSGSTDRGNRTNGGQFHIPNSFWKKLSDKANRINPYELPNYHYCPEEYSMKLIELRYSEKTIKLYKGFFEEFINYYPTYDVKMIIKFLRYWVTQRKISITYQNQSINAIKFYYEKVLGGQRKFYFIDRPPPKKNHCPRYRDIPYYQRKYSKLYEPISKNIDHKFGYLKM